MTRTCTVDGCDRELARGLCVVHYQRLRKKGLPPRPTAAERLALGLVRQSNGCLEWTGAVDKSGYGSISVNNGHRGTHRLAWTLEHGPIPPGLLVLHHCDNPPCCDAVDTEHHLFLGTYADNNADMAAKGRWRSNGNETKTHCPQGHPYDEANTYVRPATGGRQCRQCGRDRHAC